MPGMSTLAEQQRQFREGLRSGAFPAALLNENSAGWQAYRHAYSARLAEALEANYPVLYRVMGDDAFAELAQAYIARHPSSRPSIRWFGDRLGEFLGEWGAPHPALLDLARLEWHIGLAFDAADATPLTLADMAGLAPQSWPGLAFALHPSCHLLRLEWDVAPVFQAERDDGAAGAPERRQQQLLVWRRGLDPRWREVDATEAALLDALAAGQVFAAVCQVAAEAGGADGADARVAGYLRCWIEEGLLLAPAARAAG